MQKYSRERERWPRHPCVVCVRFFYLLSISFLASALAIFSQFLKEFKFLQNREKRGSNGFLVLMIRIMFAGRSIAFLTRNETKKIVYTIFFCQVVFVHCLSISYSIGVITQLFFVRYHRDGAHTQQPTYRTNNKKNI